MGPVDGGVEGGVDVGGEDVCSTPSSSPEPILFALPSGYGAGSFSAVGNLANCGASGAPGFQVIDMNGDGRPDLVVYATCASGSMVVRDHWRVYLNSGSGFAAEATMFPLPGGYSAGSFARPGNLLNCGALNAPGFSLMDLNGDRRPDIVVHGICASGSAVGSDHWRVYLNSGSGFAAEATMFPLPGGYSAGSFARPGNLLNCGALNAPGFQVVDMNGDGRPDIVVNAICASGSTVGRDHWRVYLNSGSGFAAEATMFPLPGGYSAGSFARPGNLLNCGALNAPGFSLMDLNGDRRPDIVVHGICASGSAVGSDHWRVYLNSGSGFAAEPMMFPLPGGYGAASFAGPGNLANCSVKSTPGYGTADMNGDARPDLVVFLACARGSTVGTDHWRVYLNTGAGFSADAARFSIPNGYGELTFSGLGGEGACGSGDYPPFSTFDIDGDRRPEIVIPRECMDDAVGTRHWKVFRNICP
jgi:hypothetical protein